MAFSEFCCRSGGSNMNGGSIAAQTEPATTPVYSATNGGWNSATGVFTPTSGNPSLTVTVGDYAHVFTDGSTTPTRVARVTAVNSTTITLSTTAGSGTAPTTAGSGLSINVGGAWLGPSGATIFPAGFITAAATNAAGNAPRINFKNDQTYSISASLTDAAGGSRTWQGYTSTFGDLGKATFDAGGNAIAIVNFSGTSNSLFDLIVTNNGSTNVAGFTVSARSSIARCVAHTIGGDGIAANGLIVVECETYACNASNTAAGCGIFCGTAINCVAHDNVGSNSSGIIAAFAVINCIAESNGSHGVTMTVNNGVGFVMGCDFYNNAGSGFSSSHTNAYMMVRNNNAIKNGAYGITFGTPSGCYFLLDNNGFGAGTEANTSGSINLSVGATSHLNEVGSVTYDSNLTPWVDPANGDFRINLTAAKGTGRGAFTQTQASYGGTIGYPDIGAAQHLETAATGGASVIG
jgi:hypothetical protein